MTTIKLWAFASLTVSFNSFWSFRITSVVRVEMGLWFNYEDAFAILSVRIMVGAIVILRSIGALMVLFGDGVRGDYLTNWASIRSWNDKLFDSLFSFSKTASLLQFHLRKTSCYLKRKELERMLIFQISIYVELLTLMGKVFPHEFVQLVP